MPKKPAKVTQIVFAIETLSLATTSLINALKHSDMTRVEALQYAQHVLSIANTLNDTAIIIINSAEKKEKDK